jgi:DNA polymerase III subunit delta
VAQPQGNILILHGEDEFGIAETIQGLLTALGDPTMAEMNTTRLDGRTHPLDELFTALRVLPFLVEYRLVVFTNPLERARTPPHQKRLLDALAKIPPTTRLVLVVDQILTSERERKDQRIHWLERWGLENPEKVALRAFPVPAGVELARWVQARAKVHAGQFTHQAASLLAQQVGPELRVLDHEIQKLLAYVNYARPVEGDDVQALTPKTARVGDFALVDALRDRNGRMALQVLHRQLEDEEPLFLFQRIVGQFRTLLQVREVLEQGGKQEEVVRGLKMHPYYARVSIEHARRFSMADLEMVYHRLLDMDVAIKTGGMAGELALDILVMELTQ